MFEGEDTEATDIAGLSFVVFTPILAPAIPWEIPDLVVVAVQGAPNWIPLPLSRQRIVQ
jgi:hypothetical protein